MRTFLEKLLQDLSFKLFSIRYNLKDHPTQTKHPLPQNPKNLLIFNLGGIGDFARMTPFLKTLRKKFPNARITVIYNGGIKDISLWRAWFDSAYAFKPTRDFYERFSTRNISLRTVFNFTPDLLKTLRKTGFDLGWAFGFHETTGNVSTLFCKLAGVQCLIGVNDGSYRSWLDIDTTPASRPTLYDFYSYGLKPLGIASNNTDMRLDLDSDCLLKAKNYLRSKGITLNQPLVILHPGAGGTAISKAWAADKFAGLADLILEHWDVSILLTGSANENPLAANIAEKIQKPVTIAAGETDLPTLAGILSQCSLLIANDTSVLHLADSAGAPKIVGLFGPTRHFQIMPAKQNFTAIQSPANCTCAVFDFCAPESVCRCNPPNASMDAITVEQVWQTIQPSLENLLTGKP